ncbi:hypothetical protein SFRURICE_000799 [Spodoptera frugiperda]|nr:hypothetical protein SFRURICE_000799 [Spodoptera frugiperda]
MYRLAVALGFTCVKFASFTPVPQKVREVRWSSVCPLSGRKMKYLLVFASVIALAVALPAREPVDPDAAESAPVPEPSVEDPAVLNGEPDAADPGFDPQELIPAALQGDGAMDRTSGIPITQNIFTRNIIMLPLRPYITI